MGTRWCLSRFWDSNALHGVFGRGGSPALGADSERLGFGAKSRVLVELDGLPFLGAGYLGAATPFKTGQLVSRHEEATLERIKRVTADLTSWDPSVSQKASRQEAIAYDTLHHVRQLFAAANAEHSSLAIQIKEGVCPFLKIKEGVCPFLKDTKKGSVPF